MKRILSLLLAAMILSAIVIPCSAMYGPHEILDYDGYLNYINTHRNKGDLWNHFIYYGQISLLGEFIAFDKGVSSEPTLKIKFKDDTGTEYFFTSDGGTNGTWIACKAAYLTDTLIPIDVLTPKKISMDQVEDLTQMTMLKYPGSSDILTYVTVGDLTYYYYSPHDPLSSIYCVFLGVYWEYNGNTCGIRPVDRYQINPLGRDSLVGRLLNYETAEAALAELTAFMEANVGAEEKNLQQAQQAQRKRERNAYFAAHKPLIIGLGIGAAIVIPAAIATPITIHRRKKKKAAMAGNVPDTDDDTPDTGDDGGT